MPKDLSGAQTGITPRKGVNDPRPNNARGRNTFPQSFMHLTTDRYGEFSPFYWCKAERGDVQNLKTDHDLHTFTMKSPMVGTLQMHKSFFKIPMQAIYPINWDKMMTIPTQGDDVPLDCRALLNIPLLVKSLIDVINSTDSNFILIKAVILLESITSHGSLFERFNYHFNYVFTFDPDGESRVVTPDEFFNEFYLALFNYLDESAYSIEVGDETYSLYNDYNKVSRRRFLELLRRNDWSNDDWSNDVHFRNDYLTADSPLLSLRSGYCSNFESTPQDCFINIEPIIAYQLACAQFGTNDFVDFIYSADLYRQNMYSLATYSKTESFFYNGVKTFYDVFSGRYFSALISDGLDDFHALDFFINLFSYQNSLRFGDYFTGAKPRPLAVGEYSAQVVDGSVSAVDVTRSIQMQRLLNRVNMVGRKLGDYLAGIFGGQLPEASKDIPLFLAHQSFTIKGFETENTGELQFDPHYQNTITSHLRSSENRHSFEIEIAEPCYIIGVNSYSMMRIYSKGIDRFAFHHDRYDDFIPEQQYIGDQDIKKAELDSSLLQPLAPFAYTLRYMEYKQRNSYASGGFIDNLPSWAFITDNTDGNPSDSNINPDYIRSSASEFDRFYKSLTDYSLGGYFHFIVAHTNITEPVRQMEYAPEILK